MIGESTRTHAHVFVSTWEIRSVDTGVNQPVITMLKIGDIYVEDFLNVVREFDTLHFNAGNM